MRRSKYFLAALIATAVLILPAITPLFAFVSSASAETATEARDKALKYAYTKAVEKCVYYDELHRDRKNIQISQGPQSWMKDNDIYVSPLIDGSDGERNCNNLFTGALNSFGYNTSTYINFFKDMGYSCNSDGTSCEFKQGKSEQIDNFRRLVVNKKLVNSQTPGMKVAEYMARFQKDCEPSALGTEPTPAQLADAKSGNNDLTVVYQLTVQDGSSSVEPVVYRFKSDNKSRDGLRVTDAPEVRCYALAAELRTDSEAAANQQSKEFDQKKKDLYLQAAIKAACGEASSSPGYIRCSDGVKSAFASCYAKAFGGGAGQGSNNNPDDVATTGDQGLANCLSAATGTSADKFMTEFQSVKSALDQLAAEYQSPSVSTADDSDDCPLPSDAEMRWLGCAVFGLMNKAVSVLHDFIQQFLYVTVANVFNDNIKSVSSTFRNIAIGLIFIAGLTMIISQALGFELFDAYTIKKLMPRLVVALLGVALAWPLMKLAVVFFNDLGLGLGSVLDGISNYEGNASSNGGGTHLLTVFFGSAAVVGTVWAMGILGGLSLLGTALLGMFIGMIVLAIRQVLILMCVILAPFAIACYVLPGTQKVWTFWKTTFLTTLMMYPIIMLFIASGRAASSIIGSNGSSGAMNILAIMLYFAPYFMLPYAFKMAGGLMSTIFSLANDRNRGMFDRMKKFRGNQIGRRMQHRGGRVSRATTERQVSLQRAMKARASRSNAFGRRVYGAGSSLLDGYQGNLEARMSAMQAASSKELNDQIATGMDDEIRGLTVNKTWAKSLGMSGITSADGYQYGNADHNGMAQTRIKQTGKGAGTRQFRTLGGAWVDEAAVDRGQKRWGSDTNAQQAALAYEMRKANSEQEVNNVNSNYATVATGIGGWGMTDTQAGGAWIGAAFENQNQHIEYKKTNWETGELGSAGYQGLVDEIYEKKGSYPLSQMHSRTIERLKQSYRDAERVASGKYQNADGTLVTSTPEQIAVAKDRKAKLQSIAEMYMHDAGMAMDADGKPTGEKPTTSTVTADGKRIVSGQGAAHVNERVWELAEMTTARKKEASGPHASADVHTSVPALNPKTGLNTIENQQSQHGN